MVLGAHLFRHLDLNDVSPFCRPLSACYCLLKLRLIKFGEMLSFSFQLFLYHNWVVELSFGETALLVNIGDDH